MAIYTRLAYQLFFDGQTPAAVAELNRDIRRTLRGTLRDVASPPPEGFLTSQDTYLGAWDSVDEVRFSALLVLRNISLNCVPRSPQFRSSLKMKRTIGSNNTA